MTIDDNTKNTGSTGRAQNSRDEDSSIDGRLRWTYHINMYVVVIIYYCFISCHQRADNNFMKKSNNIIVSNNNVGIELFVESLPPT